MIYPLVQFRTFSRLSGSNSPRLCLEAFAPIPPCTMRLFTGLSVFTGRCLSKTTPLIQTERVRIFVGVRCCFLQFVALM